MTYRRLLEEVSMFSNKLGYLETRLESIERRIENFQSYVNRYEYVIDRAIKDGQNSFKVEGYKNLVENKFIEVNKRIERVSLRIEDIRQGESDE